MTSAPYTTDPIPKPKDPLPASDSEFRIAMRVFLKNKIAVVCVVLLGLLYFSAIFATLTL